MMEMMMMSIAADDFQGWEVVAEWRWAAEVEVVAEEVVSGGRRGEGEKR
ncbi:hypothetical protein HanXRQr2_Chr10g0419731 [Helianthus annuus]|uniref:Uncharacterized protein n=1 Tax=Helianthus annuus TaxID=4232 RepID=A0A9K3HUG5_HELAN|nr:hypothetical protein HanXRQr2_Chr10g0419731 [Helianthus annuus]KAJ0695405.1 hypothetical protein HanLR1_Chr10g0345181 [Helianthus annuus]